MQNRSYSFKKTTAHPRSTSAAFTIVELLIVIVVIAILAAITVVAYNGIQNRARAAATDADLSNIEKKLHIYYVNYEKTPDSLEELRAGDFGALVDRIVWGESYIPRESSTRTPKGSYYVNGENIERDKYFDGYYWDYTENTWKHRWWYWMSTDDQIQHDTESLDCIEDFVEDCRSPESDESDEPDEPDEPGIIYN